MRFVTAGNLRPGMMVGRHFYNNSLNIMLRKGVKLTDAHIRTISLVNISGIYIDDAQTRDIVIRPLIDEDMKLKFASEVKDIFSTVKAKVKPDADRLERMIRNLIDQLSSRANHVVNMFDLKSFDDYTFQHSIDVCILATVVGQAANLTGNQLNNLAVAAVYHDIGMRFIDPRIVNKRERLTDAETETLRTHPVLGADFVKKLDIRRSDVLSGVLHHHERFDGTGYPHAQSGDQISFFARIIALADVYDAITSRRPYSEAAPPSEAVEYIMANAGRHFDARLTQLFLDNISVYPVGSVVRLSDSRIGIVAENYPGYTLRPLVKIFGDIPGGPPRFLNLKDDIDAQTLTIVDMLS